MKNDAFLFLILTLILGLVVGFVYLAHNPDTPILVEAESWDFVGDPVREFRSRYGGTPTQLPRRGPVSDEGEGGTEIIVIPTMDSPKEVVRRARKTGRPPEPQEPDEPIDLTHLSEAPESKVRITTETQTAPAPIRRVEMEPLDFTQDQPILDSMITDWFWLLPGNPIREKPEGGSRVVGELNAMAFLPVIGDVGDWVEVMHNGESGWVQRSWTPPFNRRKARRGIMRHRAEPVRGNAGDRLYEARKVLGIKRPKVKLGAYTLYTDVEDQELLDFLNTTALAAEEAYFARYGRLPEGNPTRSVVLFAEEEDYRRYSESSNTPTSSHVGHAGRGVIAMYVGEFRRETVAGTLIHEIGHLLNTRALTMFLPPWLEEGIASDLGGIWIERSGALFQREEKHFLILRQLLESDRFPRLAQIINAKGKDFYTIPGSYALSFAFVRYLMDGEDGALRDGFREFLRNIAIGKKADLFKDTGRSGEELERGFLRWLGAEIKDSR